MLQTEAFEKSILEKGASRNTLSSYRSDLSLFAAYCAEQDYEDPAELTGEQLSAYFEYLRSIGKSPATVRRARSSLSTYYTFLQKEGLTDTNPVRETKLEKSQDLQQTPQVLTHAEIDRLLDYDFGSDEKGIRDKAIVELLYASGIKISSLIALRETDYQPQTRTIYAEGRRVPLYPSANQSLLNYIRLSRPYIALPEETALFVNLQGSAMSRQGLWKMLRHAADAVGIDKNLTPRLLRRSFAVHLLENGAGPEDLEKMLGLSDKASVAGYVKLMKGSETIDTYTRFHPRAAKRH